MTSPRAFRSLWKHTFIFTALLIGGAGSALHAQDTTAPSNPPPGNPPTSTNVDSAGRPPDSTAVPPGQAGARPDSLVPDSLRRDTSAAGSTPSGTSPPTATPPEPPPAVDSVLAAACRASGGEAPDLLTVVFQPTSTPEERQQAARGVGGTLLEPSQHQAPGAWYVQVPGSGRNPHVADRLILMPPVLEVGATRCPS
jgi:hypothetical protein